MNILLSLIVWLPALLTVSVPAHGAPLVGNTRLTAYDGQQADKFGKSLDIAPDGKMILIGAPPGSSLDSGAAYLFSSFSTSAGIKLRPDDSIANGQFGAAVALSDNKTTAIIGAPDAQIGSHFYQGAAYIFTSSGGWVQQQKLVAPDGVDEAMFGCSVDIDDEGNTVIIGSCSNASMNNLISKVYVFVRNGSTWSLQQSFRAHDTEPDDSFASSVAISGNGNAVLVGAFMDNVGSNIDQGSAYIFSRNGTQWSEQQKLTAGDGTAWDSFGNSVDLSSDGNMAIVGAYNKNDRGAAYVFIRGSSSWGQQQKLSASLPNPYYSSFGQAVALTNNASTAVIGDYQCAYLFSRDSTTWSEQERLITRDQNVYGFGDSVSLSDDGKVVIVGAPDTTDVGVVYIFRPVIPLVAPRILLLRDPIF